MMLRSTISHPQTFPVSIFNPNPLNNRSINFSFFPPNSGTLCLTTTRKLRLRAGNGDNDLKRDPSETEARDSSGSLFGEDDRKTDRRPVFNIRWGDLLSPDPDNVVAVALTGLLTWASIQVLWQLFFISVAIIVAALKYSFIAALLIFILITLL